MPGKPKQWKRPDYLDSWGPPYFQNEQYLFREPMIKKHYDAMTWAGNQIGFLMQAAIEAIVETGGSKAKAMDLLKSKLREARKKEAQALMEEKKIPMEERNARLIANMCLQWEAALGVSGEVMINTPERYLRRFYGGDPWDKHLNGLILEIMGAEGEGMAQGINPKLTFRTNRYSCAGDPFDEWVIEPIDEESVGREPRIPDGSDQ
jgi:hypothetical protein